VENNLLERDMPFIYRGIDKADRQQVLQDNSLRINPILGRYRMNFSKTAVSQLLSRHLHWQMFFHTVGDLTSKVL
jgi:hypothetical protein